jgi:ankyrin repeat protein
MANNIDPDEDADFFNGEIFPLREAVQTNNVEQVKRLLKHGTNVNQQTAAGTTALGVAILHNNIPMVKVLLDNGAHPDKGVPDSLPLTLAINHENLDIVELLLSANADVYKVDPYLDQSPLEYVDETEFDHGDELREMFQYHLQRRRRLMSSARNLRALNVALGKNHYNHFEPISGPALSADPVSVIGEFLSGSKRKTIKQKTENLKIRASPPAPSPSPSPSPSPRKGKRQQKRKTRRQSRRR